MRPSSFVAVAVPALLTASAPAVAYEVEVEGVVCVGVVCLAALLDELRRIEGGEVRIAVDVGVHLGELEAIGVGKQLGVELGPADHEQRRRPADGGDRGRGVGEAFGAFGAELRVAAYDEVASSGQRTAERLPGLASIRMGWPSVSARKCCRSALSRHGSSLSRPMVPLRATAAMRTISGRFIPPPEP